MPTITIRIDVPDGTTIAIEQEPDEELTPEAGSVHSKQLPDAVERYWHDYLSNNGRELYGAAATVEQDRGTGYTLEDIAEQMDRKYASAQSIHRTTGRSARRWKDDTGTEPPIRLEWTQYEWEETSGGMRTRYQLPPGVADKVAKL